VLAAIVQGQVELLYGIEGRSPQDFGYLHSTWKLWSQREGQTVGIVLFGTTCTCNSCREERSLELDRDWIFELILSSRVRVRAHKVLSSGIVPLL
jgi:hypothetical protein